MKHQKNDIVELSGGQFRKFITDNRVVLVDFWAAWCMPCHMQGRIIKDKLRNMPAGGKVAKFNVERYPSIANKFNIRSIPQIYLFVDGEIKKGWTGVTPPKVLFSEMAKYL